MTYYWPKLWRGLFVFLLIVALVYGLFMFKTSVAGQPGTKNLMHRHTEIIEEINNL